MMTYNERSRDKEKNGEKVIIGATHIPSLQSREETNHERV
jgi:hypothetical protein